ncbi:PhzF family phenazine biosynthesis protein [Rhodotorula paludigena]|uniref:PhzF family phenazine biosynthesis protein n=1 Tax=Rhodotorula paludigena TaxID=86838 RepID=UPI00317B72E5
MPCRYQLIDAFTREAFSGNPAAVVYLEADDSRVGDATFMLNVAREYNLQETAFLVPLTAQDDGDRSVPRYSLRWFTPVQEFPLCGHATLASAHSLFSTEHPGATRLRFDTMSGTLEAEKLADGRIELDFPADVGVLDAANKDELKSLRAMAELAIPGSSDAIKHIVLGKLGVIVQLDRNFDLQNATVDAISLKSSSRYFIFTQAFEPKSSSIYSRVFDGAEACPEDPVTGSAHCMLAPYYLSPDSPGFTSLFPASSGTTRPLPDTLQARQGGPRQGVLEVCWRREDGRVKLRGHAVTVMDGTLHA